ncbi:MAG: GNAT family N-acetyltransferase [Rhodocyclaceae bacterium]|nr:GNAT family N-acetyltransferase [Rhodocyclaceae bacterium]
MVEQLDTPSLRMTWSEAPWDSAVCGFPVMQITAIQVLGPDAGSDIHIFERERDRLGAGLVSCRLPHECLTESMLLEDRGFRFIEMLYQPELDLSNYCCDASIVQLDVTRARDEDLPELMEIARGSFQSERFKMDPRLDPGVSDQRYQNWVASSLHHHAQALYVIREGNRPVAFFVTEMLDDGTCYWHLNAVAPGAQGQGYGRRAWLSMLNLASNIGARRVRTSIVARNHRVLNLYGSLGFRFPPPLMTFHWVRLKA